MFQLVELRPGELSLDPEPLRRRDGTLRLLRTGKAAAKFARIVSQGTGRKVQPRPFSDVNWKQRELNRLADGTYLPLPWAREDWWQLRGPLATHFPHVSKKYPGRVAFTENAAKGIADIQTPMKAGRYLKRFCQALDENTVAMWAARFSAQFEDGILQFAETREEIRDVYLRGPASCMSHPTEDYVSSPIHPSEAYASGDCAVAYLERDGRITARAVVCHSLKRHSTIYGDYDRLQPLLSAADYYSGSIQGAKLLAIAHNGGFVAPYVDCGGGYLRPEPVDDPKYLICTDQCGAGRTINYDGCSTNGMVGDYERHDYVCERCETSLYEEEVYNFSDSSYCEECWGEVAFHCSECGEAHPSDTQVDVLAIHSTQSWCQNCASDDAVLTEDDGYVSLAQYDRAGGTCEHCDLSFNNLAAHEPCAWVLATATGVDHA